MKESNRDLLRKAAVVITVPCIVFWPFYAFVVFPWIVPADHNSSLVSVYQAASFLGVLMLGVCVATLVFAGSSFGSKAAAFRFAVAPFLITVLAACFTKPTQLIPVIDTFRIPALLASGIAILVIALVPKKSKQKGTEPTTGEYSHVPRETLS